MFYNLNMEKIQIDKKVYEKLEVVYKKLILKDLSFSEIRTLQYLIKTKLPKRKVKLFGLINEYKNTKDTYLKIFLYNLLNELSD